MTVKKETLSGEYSRKVRNHGSYRPKVGGGDHDGGRENRRTVFIRIRICQAVSSDLREGFQQGEGKESDSQGVSNRQDAGDSSDALFKILGQSRNKQ